MASLNLAVAVDCHPACPGLSPHRLGVDVVVSGQCKARAQSQKAQGVLTLGLGSCRASRPLTFCQ